MKTLGNIFDIIAEFGSDLFVTFFFSGFIGSMLCLIWAVYVVRIAKRKGYFDRPNPIWTLVANFNKYYLSCIMVIMIGFLSGIYGVHTKVNNKIESKVETTIEKRSYLSAFAKPIKTGINHYATGYVDGVFGLAYRSVLSFFVLGFLKLSILEIIAFFLYRKFFNSYEEEDEFVVANSGY